MNPPATALFISSIFEKLNRPVAYISNDLEEINNLNANLLNFLPKEQILLFQKEVWQYQQLLENLDRKKNFVLLLLASLLSCDLPAKADDFICHLEKFKPFSYEQLLNWLEANNFIQTDLVSEEGEYARRGCIIDIFPSNFSDPIRVEFKDDKIFSLRYFDTITQRSFSEINEIKIVANKIERIVQPVKLLSLIKEWLIITDTEIEEAISPAIIFKEEGEYSLGITEPNIYFGNLKLLKTEMDAAADSYYLVVADYLIPRLEKILSDRAIFLQGNLTSGFLCSQIGMVVLTEKELYGAPLRRLLKRKFKGIPLDDLLTLVKGDYVVHSDYGVGIFEGIEKRDFAGIEKAYITISYADNARLYLPVENFALIERYIGLEDRKPVLDRLGTPHWQRVKNRISRDCETEAKELLELEAQRKISKRAPYSKDTDWEMELEASFPYEETKDQLKALSEIKRDMENELPMNRLVCGDVGFGKTEIAIRASFKAVKDFKQVAVLVPTTILALQHYNTFCQRLKKFPVKIEMLSRFTPPKKKGEVLKDLAEGKIDIVIGTHALLSPKVRFKDLGLLIIDDEHKFGVRHKERLKRLRVNIDVLSLTATPIPRTLYTALAGLKNISVINTPPIGRKDIVTQVSTWNDSLIRDAILKEISRQGQVFFIHNRISDLEKIERQLKSLCPEVRFTYAHAKLPKRKLAMIYADFLENRYDVLISTAIMESGIDIPNVNTIIVNNADEFGLADLHQLRGRVGRSDKQGFAYFLVSPKRAMSPEVKKRLSAIMAYSSLGAGMRLAMRDLEMRGAGELLGTKQHGHIARIGLNHYCKLLSEAVKRLRGEAVLLEPELKIELSAYIPESFILSDYERVAIYKKILGLENENELTQLKEEIRDRFGEYPEVMENLLKIAQVRILARKKEVQKVTFKNGIFEVQKKEERVIKKGDIDALIRFLAS